MNTGDKSKATTPSPPLSRGNKSERFALAILALSAVICFGEASYAEDRKPSEYEVKAAYIYNFAKFVEWPASPSRDAGSQMTVCVIGKDPFGAALQAVEGKTVRNKKIGIKRPTLQGLSSCDIIFVGSPEKEHLSQVLESIRGLPVLTIGDAAGLGRQGVMINFYIEDKTVRFEINPKAAERAGLKVSSNLMKIARIVGGP